MNRRRCQLLLALAGVLAAAQAAQAQPRPYIGYVYPAGGRQGTTFQVRLAGQNLDDVNQAVVSGTGVSAKVVEYRRRLNNQELQLMREQINELKRGLPRGVVTRKPASGDAVKPRQEIPLPPDASPKDRAAVKMIARLESRMADFIQRPACAALSSTVLVEVKVAPDAEPGPRELTLATPRGVSNPLVFNVGQLPEVNRKPMRTAEFQVLGKEEFALRKRPDDEIEQRVAVPSTLNGQIASGEVNRYRFEAHKGQRLVISCQARQLVPFIADAVPGWFQPVLALDDARGKELAYDDDYRFKPDPTILFEVPEDGEYVLDITDAIFRGREDFVYRITLGETPFITSIFPLGGRAGAATAVQMKGWNLDGAELTTPGPDAAPGIYAVTASKGGVVSNGVPFELDTLPECVEKEPNNDASHAQKVNLPVNVNGRINRPGDWDVFRFEGREGEMVVAEVTARRLDSPLDSLLKVTDEAGKVLAVNDDHEDPEAGINTHDADSYLVVKLPADGTYYVHIGDTAHNGGEEYAYRLRISAPRPDFGLRIVPSSVSFRGKGFGSISVQAIRKDGFAGPIKLSLKDPPEGFSATATPMSGTAGKLAVKVNATAPTRPVTLRVEGRATIDGQEIVHQAVAAEDRMQAFLWRHIVPAQELKALVFDPTYQPPKKRVARVQPPTPAQIKAAPAPPIDPKTGKPKFTKQQVAGRIRQINVLYEEGLITEEFYDKKIAECEAAL